MKVFNNGRKKRMKRGVIVMFGLHVNNTGDKKSMWLYNTWSTVQQWAYLESKATCVDVEREALFWKARKEKDAKTKEAEHYCRCTERCTNHHIKVKKTSLISSILYILEECSFVRFHLSIILLDFFCKLQHQHGFLISKTCGLFSGKETGDMEMMILNVILNCTGSQFMETNMRKNVIAEYQSVIWQKCLKVFTEITCYPCEV